MGSYYGKRENEANRIHLEAIALNPLRVECALCPWTAEGLTGDILEAQHAHRKEHGFGAPRQRHRARSLNFGQARLNDEERAEIAAEVARRKRLYGIAEEAA